MVLGDGYSSPGTVWTAVIDMPAYTCWELESGCSEAPVYQVWRAWLPLLWSSLENRRGDARLWLGGSELTGGWGRLGRCPVPSPGAAHIGGTPGTLPALEGLSRASRLSAPWRGLVVPAPRGPWLSALPYQITKWLLSFEAFILVSNVKFKNKNHRIISRYIIRFSTDIGFKGIEADRWSAPFSRSLGFVPVIQ